MASGGPQTAESMVEVDTAELGDDQGGCGCPDLGPYIIGGGSVGHDLRVVDVGHDTTHWEGFGRIPPQVVPQADGEATLERTGWSIDLSPPRGGDVGGGTAGGGDLSLLPTEHSRTVYFNLAHHVPVSGDRVEARVKGGQSVVGSVQNGFGGDLDGSSGGEMDGGGGGYGWDGDGDGLNLWEDNVANATLGTEPNAPLAYATGLEHHHPIMSKLGDPGGRSYREIEVNYPVDPENYFHKFLVVIYM